MANSKKSIDWKMMILAAMAALGLVLSIVTAWNAWHSPMVFLPGGYVAMIVGLTVTLSGAIFATYKPGFEGFKLLIACLLVIGILIQLNALDLTQYGHKAHAATSVTSTTKP